MVGVNAESWFSEKLGEELGEGAVVLPERYSLPELMQRAISDCKAGRKPKLVIHIQKTSEFRRMEKPVVKVLPHKLREFAELCGDAAWVRKFSEDEQKAVFGLLENAAESISVDEVIKQL